MVEGVDHGIRPWGSYKVLDQGIGYKVKRLMILPEKRLSLQMHNQRDEKWIVVAGTGRVTIGDETKKIWVGQYLEIPNKTVHRIENDGEDDLIIIEVQFGDYLGEDDIERFADDYGRR